MDNVQLKDAANVAVAMSTEEVTQLNGTPANAQHVQRVALTTLVGDGAAQDVGSDQRLPTQALVAYLGERVVFPGDPPTVVTPKIPVGRETGLPVVIAKNWLRQNNGESVADFVARAHFVGCTTLRVYYLNETGPVNVGQTPRLDLTISLQQAVIRRVLTMLNSDVELQVDAPYEIIDTTLDPAISNVSGFSGATVTIILAAY
jgi:hypothetical protein